MEFKTRKQREQREYEAGLRRLTKTAMRGPEADQDDDEGDAAPEHPVIGLRLMPEGKDFLLDDIRIKGQAHRVSRVLVIGAGPTCAIRVDDPAVSFAHCLITRYGSHVYAHDVSKNGLIVNGHRVRTRELFEGFTITMGTTSFVAISARSRQRPVVSGETHASIIQNALHVYGGIRAAARGLRVPYSTYRKWLQEGQEKKERRRRR